MCQGHLSTISQCRFPVGPSEGLNFCPIASGQQFTQFPYKSVFGLRHAVPVPLVAKSMPNKAASNGGVLYWERRSCQRHQAYKLSKVARTVPPPPPTTTFGQIYERGRPNGHDVRCMLNEVRRM